MCEYVPGGHVYGSVCEDMKSACVRESERVSDRTRERERVREIERKRERGSERERGGRGEMCAGECESLE